MSELARALGMEEEIEYKGKKYKLAPLHIEIVALYEKWLRNRDYEMLQQDKSLYKQDEYQEQMRAIRRDAAAGVYSLFGDVGQKSLKSIDGIKYMTYLRLHYCEREITEDFVEEMLTDEFENALQRIQEKAAMMDADPNRKGPASKTSPA